MRRGAEAAVSWILIPAPCLILAALLYFHGDHVLWAWGWPLLAAAVAIDWTTRLLLLPACNAGRLLHSRRMRIQLELELVLFDWSARQRAGGDAADVPQRLRAVRRDARGTRLAERIDGILGAIGGDEAARRNVGEQLRAALDDLPRRSDQRFASGRGWMLPPACILPASVAMAFAGVMLVPVSATATILTLGGLLQGLVLFGLFYVTLRLAQAVCWKLHEIVSQRTFRVVMVSARKSLNAMGHLAAELYADIGHFVIIHIDDDVGEFRASTVTGAWHVCVAQAGLADALAAFARNADLIVLDAEDASLAAAIKAATSLPATRYLALSQNGCVPAGYLWLEPMTLRARPSRLRSQTRDADYYPVGVISGTALWNEWLAQSFLLFGLLLFFHGGEALAVLFWLAAVGCVLPNQLIPRRRATISRAKLRIPRAPRFSYRLAPRVLGTRLMIGFALIGLAACALARPPVGIAWGSDAQDLLVLKFCGLYLLLFAVHTGLVSGALFALKASIDWNFRLLVLRRNSRRYGYGHKAFVMATCGRYGQVISLRDDTLDQTDDDYGEWRESSLASWFPIFSEIECTLRPLAFLHSWQRQVLLELEVTDFAVFDWNEEITDNMRWELRSAGERLPAHRILIIFSPQNQAPLDEFFASSGNIFAGRPHCLMLSRGPDDEFIWADHSKFDRAFSEGLHNALSALKEEPRGGYPREATGVWPYPRRQPSSAPSR